jgi:hypothetical protein
MHKLTDLVHIIIYIRPSKGEILKSTNNLSKMSGIRNNSPDYNMILEPEAKVLTGLHDDILVQKRISRTYLCRPSMRSILV